LLLTGGGPVKSLQAWARGSLLLSAARGFLPIDTLPRPQLPPRRPAETRQPCSAVEELPSHPWSSSGSSPVPVASSSGALGLLLLHAVAAMNPLRHQKRRRVDRPLPRSSLIG
jgi:hypothetical protein